MPNLESSKNGCLLLNVGPRADGTIPDEDQAILREIGKWLRLNGEAIYGTRYWKVYGEGPTGTATGHLAEKKDKPFTAEDIRFTTKGDVLYATILDWPPSGKSTIKSLAADSPHYLGEIQSVSMLGSSDSITFERTDEGLVVRLPRVKPCDHAFVLKIE
jgi:alpha-L-fucosidase